MRILGMIIVALTLSYSLGAQDRLSAEKLWELGRVSLEDVSPNGLLVLYSVKFYDLEENSGNRDLYIMAVEADSATRITAFSEDEYNGRFRPDGKRIGFLSGGKFWEMALNGSDKEQLSGEYFGGFEYAPDLRHVLFTKEVDYRTPSPLMKGLDKANARIIDNLMYRHWDEWEDGFHSNVFYAPYDDSLGLGKAVNIMEEPFDSPLKPFGGMEQISWSADGAAIAYTCKKMSGREYAESTNSDIYLHFLETGKTLNVTRDNPGYDKNPVFSSDGKWLAWNSMASPGYEADRNRIMLLDLETGEKSELTAGLEYSADLPVFSGDGKVYFVGGIEATYQVFEADIQTGEHRQLTTGRHNFYDLLPAREFLIGLRASMSAPHELFTIDRQNGAMRQLTFTNKQMLDSIEMGRVEKRLVKTVDGSDMLVWWIYPPGFDSTRRYPTLLYCQGGPQSAVSQFFSYRWNFQMMAANDYIVVAPNRRGLPTFGREWNEQISGNWGGLAMQDYLAAIDDAVTRPFVDRYSLGAVGASYGGYSVYWLAGNHDGRFRSFISHCGLFNLESWYATTEEYFFANYDLEGPYWQEQMPLTYMTDSPHQYVQNWDTPILVVHGEKDFRVPVSEGIQAFHAAQLQGVKSRFLYFPNEGHWVLSPQNGVLWHRVFFDWLDGTLKN